jgi:hypothetical protein
MNHSFAMQKPDTLCDIQHDIPNLLTFQRWRLILDEIYSNSGWILFAINVVVQVQVTQFHVDEEKWGDIADFHDGNDVWMGAAFEEFQNSLDFILYNFRTDTRDED